MNLFSTTKVKKTILRQIEEVDMVSTKKPTPGAATHNTEGSYQYSASPGRVKG